MATNSDGRQLFTSQLFWNQATHKVYSNVDSKIVDGDEVHHCEGFESDEAMKDWSYRKLKGVTYIEDSDLTTSDADSTRTVEPAPVVTPPVAPSSNVTRPRARQLPTLKERVERGEATPNEVQLPITTIEKR